MSISDELRQLAYGATPGPWEVEPYIVGNDVDGGAVSSKQGGLVTNSGYEGLDPACSTEDAAYIAALSPNVALALADLLDQVQQLCPGELALAAAFDRVNQEWAR